MRCGQRFKSVWPNHVNLCTESQLIDMQIPDFIPFVGQHCETTTTGTLLRRIGVELSEPMLFGLGEGLGFIFWNMKSMEFPFIGGRVKPDVLTANICRNLGLTLDVKQTASAKKAWDNCVTPLKNGQAVGLKLDCFHLDYFTTKVHFAGHYAALYGHDDQFAYLVDTQQQGGEVKTSLESLRLARCEKGPMSSRNLSYTIGKTGAPYDLETAVRQAIRNNVREYLNPPITNLTYKGILKTSKEIKKWFNRSTNKKYEFQTTAMLMERAGTGGSLFRNLFRDFLQQIIQELGFTELAGAHEQFCGISEQWKRVSDLLHEAGETENIASINEASKILVSLSQQEYAAMSQLADV